MNHYYSDIVFSNSELTPFSLYFPLKISYNCPNSNMLNTYASEFAAKIIELYQSEWRFR